MRNNGGTIRRRTYIAAGLVIIGVVSLAAYLVRPDAGGPVPSFEETRAGYDRSDARLYDRNGVPIHELRVDFDVRKTGWTRLDDISPALVDAVLASEDRRFIRHSGVDWLSFASATVGNLFNGRTRGASTITMQLASRIIPGLKPAGGRRDIAQKLAQIRSARALERDWSKDEILEAYLNLVSFRGELTGISAASRGMFGKEPDGLDMPESLVLASLIRAPGASAGEVQRRAQDLAAALGSQADLPEIRAAASAVTNGYRIRPRIALAPHVARKLLGRDTRSATSTLDAGLQRFAVELVGYYMGPIKSRNVGDCALLVVDNSTGEAICYVGNSGEDSTAVYVDGVRAKRQAGSTLKPFLYGLAIEKRIITPASLLDDSPIDVPTARGIYSPGDYDGRFRGIVTARTALASSLNVPAVRVLALMGEETFKSRLCDLGINGLREGDYYGLSLALGTAEVSLWELVNAYRTLANGGVYSELTLQPIGNPPPVTRVYSRQAAFLVSDMLSDREARAATFGLENPLSTRFWSAVKTGTSKDMRDNWCIGYSSRYTVGVWVGNFSGEPMWDVSGITGAAPIWYEMMTHLHAGVKSEAPTPPPGVVKNDVEFADTGYTRSEWFIKGTEPAQVKLAISEPVCRILYPPMDTVMAIDPDIPSGMQKIFFESSSNNVEIRWFLDGDYIGGLTDASWTPVSGKHGLAIADEAGRILDEVTFRVK